jgi:hypothetical protein
LLREAAFDGDIPLCRSVLSREDVDLHTLLDVLEQTESTELKEFALDLFEQAFEDPDRRKDRFGFARRPNSDEVIHLLVPIGRTGNRDLCLRAKAVVEKACTIWAKECGPRVPDIPLTTPRGALGRLLIEVASSGNIALCEEIMSWYGYSPDRMLTGGSLADTPDVCERAIELGAIIRNTRGVFHHMPCRLARFSVFKLLLECEMEQEKSFLGETAYEQWKNDYSYGFTCLASCGPDSMQKLHLIQSLGFVVDPNTVLAAAAWEGNIELCRFAKQLGAELTGLLLDGVRGNLTRPMIDLVREFGLDINDINLSSAARMRGDLHDPQSPFLRSLGIRDKAMDSAAHIGLRKYLHRLIKYGYRKYSVLLDIAMFVGHKELVEEMVALGKDRLLPGDPDYEAFTKLVETLPTNDHK